MGVFEHLLWREMGLDPPSELQRLERTRRLLTVDIDPDISLALTHSSSINSVQIDGIEHRYLLSGATDGSLAIYDTQAVPETPQVDLGRGNTVDIHGHRDATGDLGDILPIVTVRRAHTYSVETVEWYAHDSGMFTTSGFDGLLHVWDANYQERVATFDLGDKIYKHASSAAALDHALIACATDNSAVRLCDLRSASQARVLQGHKGEDGVRTVAWCPSDQWILATGGGDGHILIWDVRMARSCLYKLNQHSSRETALARRRMRLSKERARDLVGKTGFVGPKGKLTVSSSPSSSPSSTVSSLKNSRDVRLDGSDALVALREGRNPAAHDGSWGSAGTRADRGGSHLRRRGEPIGAETVNGSSRAPRRAKLRANNRVMDQLNGVAAAASDHVDHADSAHGEAVVSLCFSPDGFSLLSLGAESKLLLWDTRLGYNKGVHYEGVKCNAPSGRKALQMDVTGQTTPEIAMVPSGKRINVYELRTGTKISALKGHYKRVNCVAYDPSYQKIYTGGNDNIIYVWSPQTVGTSRLEGMLREQGQGVPGDETAAERDAEQLGRLIGDDFSSGDEDDDDN
eukprot:Clim_evm44s158 gene=Clim_evmTU44s158